MKFSLETFISVFAALLVFAIINRMMLQNVLKKLPSFGGEETESYDDDEDEDV